MVLPGSFGVSDLDDIAFPRESLLVRVYLAYGMSYALIKYVASKVLCAPILLTPISNRVRISSIIHTDGHCGISKMV